MSKNKQEKQGRKEAAKRRSLFYIVKTTVKEWSQDKASYHAAAMAYYIIFSLAPLLVIGVAVAGIIWGEEAARGQITAQAQQLTGNPQTAQLLQGMLESTNRQRTNIWATILGFATILFGASGAFRQLKYALNSIWDAEPPPSKGIWDFIKRQVLPLAMVLGSGLIILASLILSTVLTALVQILPTPFNTEWVLQATSFVVFLIVTMLAIAPIFKYLPDVELRWRDVWIGAGVTALLFSIGRYLISLYMAYSAPGSAYGAAASLAVLLIWLYYSAQIFFVGAEFTQVWVRTRGSRADEAQLLEDNPKEEAQRSLAAAVVEDRPVQEATARAADAAAGAAAGSAGEAHRRNGALTYTPSPAQAIYTPPRPAVSGATPEATAPMAASSVRSPAPAAAPYDGRPLLATVSLLAGALALSILRGQKPAGSSSDPTPGAKLPR